MPPLRKAAKRTKRLDGEPEQYECCMCKEPKKWTKFPLPQNRPGHGGMKLQPCYECGRTYRQQRKEAAGRGHGRQEGQHKAQGV